MRNTEDLYVPGRDERQYHRYREGIGWSKSLPNGSLQASNHTSSLQNLVVGNKGSGNKHVEALKLLDFLLHGVYT